MTQLEQLLAVLRLKFPRLTTKKIAELACGIIMEQPTKITEEK